MIQTYIAYLWPVPCQCTFHGSFFNIFVKNYRKLNINLGFSRELIKTSPNWGTFCSQCKKNVKNQFPKPDITAHRSFYLTVLIKSSLEFMRGYRSVSEGLSARKIDEIGKKMLNSIPKANTTAYGFFYLIFLIMGSPKFMRSPASTTKGLQARN